jgi:hypothetical protein
VDTTPPVITLSLDRDQLWPPNHKLADVNATVAVTDICDPNPTFVLLSITSDEPDNGLGDGDTENDIQDAAYGSADVAFRLRSERSRLGDGREYVVTYLASDCSGNTAIARDTVIVPHDRHGGALAADGLSVDGRGFAADAVGRPRRRGPRAAGRRVSGAPRRRCVPPHGEGGAREVDGRDTSHTRSGRRGAVAPAAGRAWARCARLEPGRGVCSRVASAWMLRAAIEHRARAHSAAKKTPLNEPTRAVV